MSKELASHLYHDNFQNFKPYGIPKAQLVIADIPYNIGDDAYGSNPTWYVGGTTKTENQIRPKAVFSILMAISELQNICTFVPQCL